MPIATLSRLATGYSTANVDEKFWFSATADGWLGAKPPLIYCHGSGHDAVTILSGSGQRPLLDALAQHYSVIAADLGLQAWGNDTHVTRIAEAVNYLATTWGIHGRVTLVAGSMGNLGALGYARAHPENVRAVAGIIPALDLADLMLRGAASDINAAYPPSYNDATMGPTHSPVQYADELDPDLNIHLWTASNDTICVPATAAAFVAARPQTIRTDLGALGHTEAAVSAAQASVLDWLATT